MGVYTVNQTDGSLQRVAGGTLFADAPIASIIPFGGETAPAGWLICDGSTLSRTEYAELFAVIGISFGEGDGETTFGIPDLRECVPVGVGKNITKSIANHDRYDLGQFKDDALGTHNHPLVSVTTATFNTAGVPVGIGNNNTPTSATHGKQLGVNYIIKAKMVGVPADLEAQIDADYQKKDLTSAVEGATTVEGALGALSTKLGKRTVSSYDLFTECGMTNGTTYTLFEFWEILFNTFGSCNLDAHMKWNGSRAFYLTDGVTTTQMISNGRINVSVENPNETWHLLHGTVQIGTAATDMQLLTLFARVGGTLSDKSQKIGGDVYTTSEIITNKLWIDGKPIYRKVIDFGALPNATTKSVAYNITNLDEFVRIEGYGLKPNSHALMPLPYAAPSDASLNVRLIVASNTVDIQTGSDRTDYNGYIILEYTKTT